MGKTISSSKRSSSKKKKSKISSQTGRKKTSRRNKSKRFHERKDSDSFSDDSLRSLSVSSFDSEEDYRSRKGRSRVREKVKTNKKRARRSSSSRDSSVDSPPIKKRKGSKRDSKVRKKTKKKHRRKASVSLSSSDSEILRARRHDSTSGEDESEYERVRGRSRKKKSDKSFDNARIRSKKSKLRSRSFSSCSRHSVSNDEQSRDKEATEIFPRRLKSVVTVVNPHHEEVEEASKSKDEHKEEIFYDQDDYPSCRSNDSNDGVKRDITHDLLESDKGRAENLWGEEDFASKLASDETKLHIGDRIDQSAELKPQPGGAWIKSPANTNEINIPTSVAGSDNDNIETILRQKALENLMKFRRPRMNAETSHHENKSENSSKTCTANVDDDRNRSSKQELSSGIGEAQTVNHNNRRIMRKDSSRSMPTEQMNLDRRNFDVESSRMVVHPSHPVSGNPKDLNYTNVAHSPDNKSGSNTTSLKQPSMGSGLALKQVLPTHVSPKAKSVVARDVISKSAAETRQNVAASSSNNQNVGVTDACGATPEPSIVKPILEDHSSKQCENEIKGNSQFEQKTMSVMRGGEMVQVSYKVYIPNKAPALARRKLQR